MDKRRERERRGARGLVRRLEEKRRVGDSDESGLKHVNYAGKYDVNAICSGRAGRVRGDAASRKFSSPNRSELISPQGCNRRTPPGVLNAASAVPSRCNAISSPR